MKLFEPIKRRLIVRVWNHTPNCAEMSRLASKAIDQPLPLWTRLKMRLHYLICVWCERFYKQIRFLRHAAHEHPDELNEATPCRLSSEARERLKRRLGNESK